MCGALVLFMLLVFVSVWWCPNTYCVVFLFVCLRFVYPLLPVSLDCPFVIAPPVFSGLSVCDCPCSILWHLFTYILDWLKDNTRFIRSNNCITVSGSLPRDLQLLWNSCHTDHHRSRTFLSPGCRCRQHLYTSPGLSGMYYCQRWFSRQAMCVLW